MFLPEKRFRGHVLGNFVRWNRVSINFSTYRARIRGASGRRIASEGALAVSNAEYFACFHG
jgi:hypothetical protein